MTGRRVAVVSHGCRLNQSEGDALSWAAQKRGHRHVPLEQDPDVIVVNSCTITDAADRDARAALRRLRQQHPAAALVLTGCYADNPTAAFDGVDLVVGNAQKEGIVEALDRVQRAADGENARAPDLIGVGQLTKKMPLWRLPPSPAPERTRGYLKVQDGCNYRCSFCIVPHVRGGSRSLPIAAAVERCRGLIEGGLPEIVLTGVHLGTYGRDLPGKPSLTDLVAALVETMAGSGRRTRLRLGSIDPHEVDDALVDLMRREGGRHLCRYLHLPVQSGHEQILREMRRGHTAEDFRVLARVLHREVPGIALGADVIVGFPGETDEQFAATRALLAESDVPFVHAFSYSPRAKTPAAERPDAITKAVKRARNEQLRVEADGRKKAFARAQAGQWLPAVVFRNRTREGRLRALTDNYLDVEFEGSGTLCRAAVELRLAPGGTVEAHRRPDA